MKVLIIANYINLPNEIGNCRFMYIANLLSKNNSVEIITSAFSHINKSKRKKEKYNSENITISLIDEPGYSKNISLKRIYSHKILSFNLKKYLSKLEYIPDIIYCATPSLDFAKEAAKFANKKNIRFIVDVQDLWPEAFKMIFNIPLINNLIFYPMKKKANYIYSRADEIVAVSETYCNRALKVNKKTSKGLSVFLGTDLEYFDKCKENNKIEFNDKFIRIAYIGTLGHSYNIKFVIDAIKVLNNKGIDNIKFIIMGDGPLKLEFEEYAKEKNINCEFTGRLKYEKMVGLLCACQIAINPIKSKSAGSIINKVGDYAAAGLPVINSQENEEYRRLIKEKEIGINVKNSDINDMADAIEKMCIDYHKRNVYGKNNRILAEKLFDRKKTYIKISSLIEKEK